MYINTSVCVSTILYIYSTYYVIMNLMHVSTVKSVKYLTLSEHVYKGATTPPLHGHFPAATMMATRMLNVRRQLDTAAPGIYICVCV